MDNNEYYDIDIRIRIKINDVVTYGSGISELLQKIDQLGSINKAAKSIGMNYKKALGIIKRAESKLDKKLIEKSIGGPKGGGSDLTQYGKFFVYQFNAMEKEVKEYTMKLMKEYFEKL